MARLTLHSMECVNKQDSISPDDIVILIGGVKVAGPFGVHQGDTVELSIKDRHFTDSTTVQLKELDPHSEDDNLGIRTVTDNRVVIKGNLKFEAAKHAFYTVNYSIYLT